MNKRLYAVLLVLGTLIFTGLNIFVMRYMSELRPATYTVVMVAIWVLTVVNIGFGVMLNLEKVLAKNKAKFTIEPIKLLVLGVPGLILTLLPLLVLMPNVLIPIGYPTNTPIIVVYQAIFGYMLVDAYIWFKYRKRDSK